MRQNLKSQRRNVRVKRAMKSDIKALTMAIASSDKSVTDKLKSAQSKIDKAVKAGLIHKNNAARKKSQLAQAAKSAGEQTKPTAKKPVKAVKKAPTKPSAKKPASK